MSATVPFPVHAAAPAQDMPRPRFGLLLVALLATLVVQGAAPVGDLQRVIVSALVGATLVLALRVGNARSWLLGAAVIAAAALVVATSIEAAAAGGNATLSTSVANALLVGAAPPAVVLGVIRAMRREGRIPVEAVIGVLCLYLLFGMFCAFVWAVLNRVDGPFFAGGQAGNASDFQYFSFVTLTTVGYGDLTARSALGHTLAVLEALVGQIYLVTVVSLFVTNVGRARARGG